MFVLNRDTELSIELLQKMINVFTGPVQARLNKYKNYYDGIQKIANKHFDDEDKPCNKEATNFMKNIVDIYCGYLATPGYISYSSPDDIEDIMEILRYNDYQTEDSEFLLDALVYGLAAELMYIDNQGQTRFRTINPTSCFGIWDDSLSNDLMYFVRIYKVNDWDDSDLHRVDVYSDFSVKHYTMTGMNGYLHFESEEPHYFSQCPANIFMLPDEKSIFDCVIGLQDSYNEAINSKIDEIQATANAYLVLSGVDVNPEDGDVEALRTGSLIALPKEGASASFLVKNANDAEHENTIKRIQADIYRIAMCPDFSSESFVGGVSSGIAIKYRLTGMESRAGIVEGKMKKALQRRIEIICGIASLKLGEEVFRDIQIEFKRNIPEDPTTIINMVNSLKGSVSDKTLLSLLPFVDDVNAEIDALNEQKQANMEMYSFAPAATEDDEEEEDI